MTRKEHNPYLRWTRFLASSHPLQPAPRLLIQLPGEALPDARRDGTRARGPGRRCLRGQLRDRDPAAAAATVASLVTEQDLLGNKTTSRGAAEGTATPIYSAARRAAASASTPSGLRPRCSIAGCTGSPRARTPTCSCSSPRARASGWRTPAGLRRDLHLRPFEADRRVYLILDAHLLRDDSANALLKSLEEPPGYGVFVLVSDHAERMLPTIRSRVATIPFRRFSQAQLLEATPATRPPPVPRSAA